MSNLLESVSDLVWQAADATLEVYRRAQSLNVQRKADDSPLTEADLASHAVLTEGLSRLTPDIPILSEESSILSWAVRQKWQKYWLIDPLDGTKEFIAGNGEFTVNLALIEQHEPALGWVAVPDQAQLYIGDSARSESYLLARDGTRTRLQCRPMQASATSASTSVITSVITSASTSVTTPVTVVASRRHRGERLEQLLTSLHSQLPSGIETQSVGSALKLCLLAKGEADLYPRLGPTSEWDIAAAQAVLVAAGGEVFTLDGALLRYNTKESLLNSDFVAVADKSYNWRKLIASSLKS